jgi:hypothetical protein
MAGFQAIEQADPLRDDLPGQGIFATPAPTMGLKIEWRVPWQNPRGNGGGVDINHTIVLIDEVPHQRGPTPCLVLTYRDDIRWEDEEDFRTDGRLFDIVYPGVSWYDQLGRLHVDCRFTPEEWVVGPYGGYSERLGTAQWYPDSFLVAADGQVRVRDTSLTHPPHAARVLVHAPATSEAMRTLRAMVAAFISDAW